MSKTGFFDQLSYYEKMALHRYFGDAERMLEYSLKNGNSGATYIKIKSKQWLHLYFFKVLMKRMKEG